jgi:hypothetical protein
LITNITLRDGTVLWMWGDAGEIRTRIQRAIHAPHGPGLVMIESTDNVCMPDPDGEGQLEVEVVYYDWVRPDFISRISQRGAPDEMQH